MDRLPFHLPVAGLCLAALAGCRGAGATDPADFAWTHGVWTGVRRDAADGTEAGMTMRVEPLLAGSGELRFLEVGSYRGVAVQHPDPERGYPVRSYANSASRRFARYRCTAAAADRSVWESFTPGRTRESRLISERLPDGLWRRTMRVSTDGGRTFRDLWIDELRRGR